MAFEVLSGALPWPGTTAASILSALLTRPAPPVSSCAHVPLAIDAVIARALEKDPEKRHASMDAIADAIEAVAAEPGATSGAASDAFARTEAARTPARSSEAFAATLAAPTPRSGEAAPSAPAASPDARPPRLGRARVASAIAVVVAIVVGAAAATTVLHTHRPGASTPHEGAPAASASVADAGPIAHDLAVGTSNEKARGAFLAALQLWHDGDELGGAIGFDEARSIDPGYGAAHLWLAAIQSANDLISARRALEKAFALRASMSAANRTFLEALLPYVQREPPDPAACIAKLEDAARASPEAAHLWFWLAMVRFNTVGPSEQTMADMSRATTADPTFVGPLPAMGQNLAYLGRFDEAIATLTRCLELAPSAATCLDNRVWIHQMRADCDAVEADARRLQAASSQSSNAYVYLADVATAKGRPLESVEDLLSQAASRVPASDRPIAGISARAAVATLRGDFEAAQRVLAEASPVLAPLSDQASHYQVRAFETALALESGKTDQAGRLAEDILRRKDSWLADPRSEDWAIARDLEPYFLDVQRRAGRISATYRASRRDAWTAAWRAKAVPFHRKYLWLNAQAALVDDEEGAREALAAQPDGGIPPFYTQTYPDEGLGKMYLLAGRAAEALPYLRRAALGCYGAENPLGYVRAALPLGQALEQTGDRDGACRAYASVTARWGKAKPRSVTAEKAKAAAKALRCPAP